MKSATVGEVTFHYTELSSNPVSLHTAPSSNYKSSQQLQQLERAESRRASRAATAIQIATEGNK